MWIPENENGEPPAWSWHRHRDPSVPSQATDRQKHQEPRLHFILIIIVRSFPSNDHTFVIKCLIFYCYRRRALITRSIFPFLHVIDAGIYISFTAFLSDIIIVIFGNDTRRCARNRYTHIGELYNISFLFHLCKCTSYTTGRYAVADRRCDGLCNCP